METGRRHTPPPAGAGGRNRRPETQTSHALWAYEGYSRNETRLAVLGTDRAAHGVFGCHPSSTLKERAFDLLVAPFSSGFSSASPYAAPVDICM